MNNSNAEQTGENTYRITVNLNGENFLIPIEGGTYQINGTFYVVEKVENVAPFVYDVTIRL